ncbi:hypothetical protein V2I01_28255 [Micromonospora sp. BRA006-A]|nr:hypothetical protein [Micromonospora sp. BRA006-A]
MTRSRRRLAALAATTLALTGLTAGPASAEVPPDAPEQLRNGDFSAGVSLVLYGTGDLAVVDGRLCTSVAAGTANPWDAGIGQDAVPLTQGAEYELSFDVSATPARPSRRCSSSAAPLHHVRERRRHRHRHREHVTTTFTSPADNPPPS